MPDSSLTDFIEQVTGDTHLRIEDDLGDGYVVLKVSEAQRRQARHDIRCTEDVVIEMLRNARDAHARNIFLAVSKEADRRTICMFDDGDGIPDHLHERIFDARVTSKLDSMHVDNWGVHGRGMALYAVRLNAERAYVAASRLNGGSSLVVQTNTRVLPEKVDQSSKPSFFYNDAGTLVVRGTRNINRVASEFAYLNRDKCSVYLGTPVEIAASLWEFGLLALSSSARAFCNDPSDLDVCKRLAASSDPDSFAKTASGLGLEISARSARRIMDGEVALPAPLAESIRPHASKESGSSRRPRPSARDNSKTLKISAEELEILRCGVHDAFQGIAQSYYLDPDVDISVRARKDGIRIFIPAEKID